MAKRILKYIKNQEDLSKKKTTYKVPIKNGLEKIKEEEKKKEEKFKKHQEQYKTCLTQIDVSNLKDVSINIKDYEKLKDDIKKLIRGADKYYIGATSDYKQRFCGDKLNPDNPVHKNCHSVLNGYTKMYVMGRTGKIDVASKLEERLIKDLKGLENSRPESVGLKDKMPPYYVYVIIKKP